MPRQTLETTHSHLRTKMPGINKEQTEFDLFFMPVGVNGKTPFGIVHGP